LIRFCRPQRVARKNSRSMSGINARYAARISAGFMVLVQGRVIDSAWLMRSYVRTLFFIAISGTIRN
jgi:hypothetical protein